MRSPNTITRKQLLKAGAAAGLAGLLPMPIQAASHIGAYRGKISVYGIAVPSPGHPGVIKLFQDFDKVHPGITIENHGFPSERFVALFTAAQAAGEQIDMLFLNGQDLRRYAVAGDLVPLNGLPHLERFWPIGRKTYTINGKLWALPTGSIGGFPIFYNKALLDKYHLPVPQTYADLLTVGKELTKQGVSAYTHDGKNIYLWPVWFFTTYAQVTANQSVEKTIATLTGHGKFTDPEVVEALDVIFGLARHKIFSPDVLSLDTDGATAEFMTGKAAFWLHYDGVIAAVRQAAPPHLNPPGMQLDVTLFPWVGKKSIKRQFPGGTGAAAGIYSKTSSARQAVVTEILEFITTDRANAYLVKDGDSTMGTNIHAKGSSDPVALKERTLLPNMTIYLDWYWPPEITRAFQEGIQAGVGLKKTAPQVARDIQATFNKLLKSGYQFAH
jgi:raffinose/stachyose/melibiose transport system substrate-binding protein